MSAQDSVYRLLKNKIATLPRDQGFFLTEAEIAAEAGVSRTPVREAMVRLEAAGLLEIIPKKGAFVRPVSDAEVTATMQACRLVESWSVVQAASRPGELVADLSELLAEQEALVLAGNAGGFIEKDGQFHRAIVQAAGNPLLTDFYESLRDRQTRMGLRTVQPGRGRGLEIIAEHTAIVNALRALDGPRAEAAVQTHLDTSLRALRSSDEHRPAMPWQSRGDSVQ
jgi:DNA-binding GntR family transcriptional regulator